MKLIIALTLLCVVCVSQIQSGYVPVSYHTYDVDPTCEHPLYSYRDCPYYRLKSFFPSLGHYAGKCGCSQCNRVVKSHAVPYYTHAYGNFVF
uniref:Uncharacterized protein n=1 Tax=Anopheles epiroticus TaxID=199890 RepID=A0A9I3FGU6_9DIPT